MAKLTYRDNYRVVSEVPKPSYMTVGHDQMMRAARELKAQIDRHCDADHSGIEFDTIHQCSACGRGWTEDSDTYNGGCCKEDQKADPELISKEPGRG